MEKLYKLANFYMFIYSLSFCFRFYLLWFVGIHILLRLHWRLVSWKPELFCSTDPPVHSLNSSVKILTDVKHQNVINLTNGTNKPTLRNSNASYFDLLRMSKKDLMDNQNVRFPLLFYFLCAGSFVTWLSSKGQFYCPNYHRTKIITVP